jgi:hypothetical protein
MMQTGSTLIGRDVEASDGEAGRVHNVVFDDITWEMRWLVVETGHPLHLRRVLLHPCVVDAVDALSGALRVKLPRASIARAPRAVAERPMSMQIESQIYDYHD